MYRQIGIPICTKCAPLVADLFLFCYERLHDVLFSDNNRADVVEAFNSTSDTEAPYLDLDLSITNGIVSSKIYDKLDGFNFEIVNFHCLMVMLFAPLPMVYTLCNLFVCESIFYYYTSREFPIQNFHRRTADIL